MCIFMYICVYKYIHTESNSEHGSWAAFLGTFGL